MSSTWVRLVTVSPLSGADVLVCGALSAFLPRLECEEKGIVLLPLESPSFPLHQLKTTYLTRLWSAPILAWAV